MYVERLGMPLADLECLHTALGDVVAVSRSGGRRTRV
jgi:hypothetical protein